MRHSLPPTPTNTTTMAHPARRHFAAALAAHFRSEAAKWAKVVKGAKIRPQ